MLHRAAIALHAPLRAAARADRTAARAALAALAARAGVRTPHGMCMCMCMCHPLQTRSDAAPVVVLAVAT